MAKRNKKEPKIVYQSIWSEKMTESEKQEAQQKIDDIFDYIFNKTIVD